ncbi:S-layer homology domain-containing protein [Oceanobacillus sp. CF4.6]|uniref:S-layer homology domain-containing protein n=1 Tax=Oceanobacillus sp. CF4.6 TaxID=3373080 RepID=UPI003EE7E039
MKNFNKLALLLLFFCSSVAVYPITTSATDDISSTCEYKGEPGVNPEIETMNCLLTEGARTYNVPPEIIKAIAQVESGGWKHFDKIGEPIISDDNGIGIMQITNQSQYDEERLKYDVVYNIQAGVEIIDSMFKRNDLPTINNGERDIIENWYFAVMAYNGIKPENSPIVQETGERNSDAYQERVFQNINELGLIELEELPFSSNDFEYDPDSNENIEFLMMDYQFSLPLTKTKHHFSDGQAVRTTAEVRMRELPNTNSDDTKLPKGESLTIEGHFQYDNHNHFVWYPIKTNDGSTGYIASSYLGYRFTDLPAGHYAEDEIYYLVDSGVLQGIGNGQFGLDVPLSRWQVALMVTRAKNLSLENRPDLAFTDVPRDHKYYDVIAAVVDEGYFEGTSNTTFDPNEIFTRREMATALDRIYQFPKASTNHPFEDIYADNNSDWYNDAVSNLYEAGITNGTGTGEFFEPFKEVSRDQFSTFLARSMNADFRLR